MPLTTSQSGELPGRADSTMEIADPTQYPNGYFADPATGKPVDGKLFLRLCHLAGTRLPGIWGVLFFWVRVPWYRLLDDLLYVTPGGDEIKVSHGFVFNGGSIPFLFRWLYTPDDPDCLPAFAVHDRLCESHRFDSGKTHAILRFACLANGARRSQANVIYRAVLVGYPCFYAEKP